ncbi:MAG: cation diffusion facilitator family transporter [Streptosporangiaceae bacterium]
MTDRRDGHAHGVSAGADQRYLGAALALIVAYMAAEVAVAVISGSLALLADAGHMLADAGALAAAVVAIRLARRPAQGPWTYGLKRAEILSAAGNGVTLLVIAALIGYEAVRRLINPPPVEGLALLVVAVVGVAVNLAATWVLAKANRRSLNIEGAFQHILTDLYAFAGTAAAGLVIYLTGYVRADPAASLLVVALMAWAAWRLMRASGRVLLQAAPADVDLADIRRHLLDTRGVRGVHDLHVWTVTSGLPVLSAHVVVDEETMTDSCGGGVLDQLQGCLYGHFDVEHSTFQLEPAGHDDHETQTHP